MYINECVSWFIESEEVGYVINTRDKKCIVLDKTAIEIWKVVLHTMNRDNVIDIMIDRYPEGDIENIEEDVDDFFKALKECGIISRKRERESEGDNTIPTNNNT